MALRRGLGHIPPAAWPSRPSPYVPEPPLARQPRGSLRFERKRELILDAATALINQRGVKGMTFLEIAQSVNLNTTSVTYYFRLKEQLAAAVFEHTIERLEAMAREAGAEADPQARVARYLQLHFDHHRRVLQGEDRPIATLSDIRALDESVRVPLEKHYQAVFRLIRGFFGRSATIWRARRCSPRARTC